MLPVALVWRGGGVSTLVGVVSETLVVRIWVARVGKEHEAWMK